MNVLSLTPEERANAPRVRRRVQAGMYQFVIDPNWLDKRLDEMDEERQKANEADRAFRRREARIALWYRRTQEAIERLDETPDPVGSRERPRTMPRRIILEIAELHGLTAAAVAGPSRIVKIAAARQHAAYELRRRTKLSTTKIGQFLGGRDHSSIVHAIQVWPAKAAALGIECLPLEGA